MKEHNVRVINTPMVSELITKLRDIKTDSQLFRIYLKDISKLLIYEALTEVKMKEKCVPTQTGADFEGEIIAERIAYISILRASLGMLSAAMEFYPAGEFHCLGMKRNEEDPRNKEPHFYLDRLEEMNPKTDRVLVMDPMLATGGSMISALKSVKEKHGFKGKIQVLSLITAEPGAKAIYKIFPEVEIICAGLDEYLNEHSYIIPGLGDAGDRLFGINTDLGSIQ
jgi:uracil phosphoribosyltransferase